MWSKPQVAAFQRTLAASEKWSSALAKLADVARHAPQFADRVKELEVRAENARLLAQTALAVDPVGR